MGKSDERVSLNEHNKYRRRVASGKVPNQPKASNLGLLVSMFLNKFTG